MSRDRRRPVLVVGAVLSVVALVVAVVIVWRWPARPGAAAIERNNHAVGLMGMYRFHEARSIFEALVEAHPGWHEARLNLAIATLNRQQEGDSELALGILAGLLEEDPGHLRANYCAGLLELYLRSPDEALEHFEIVAAADPRDPYAAYYVGDCHRQDQDYAAALPWFEKALGLDPYLRSAYYALGQLYQRLDRPDDALAMLEDFQRLDGNPRAYLVEFKYTRMGAYGEAVAVGLKAVRPPARVVGPLFAEAASIPTGNTFFWADPVAPGTPGPAVTVGDLNGDGRLDLFLCGAVAGDSGTRLNAVFRGQADGRFALVLGHPLAGVSEVNAALWGDVDNDGLDDVYLCRRGPNVLMRQTAPGQWADVTGSTATAGDALDTVDGAMIDADHDGDLDIFCVNADGPNELLNNNLDGTFRPIAGDSGIAGDGRASIQVLAADLDRDRDADLLVINREPPHEVYLNDRLWSYREAPGFGALKNEPIIAAVPADLDADGRLELITLRLDGTLARWARGTDGTWTAMATMRGGEPPSPSRRLAVADVTGDGALELLVSGPEKLDVLAVAGPALETRAELPLRGTAWSVLVADPARGPAVVSLGPNDPLLWAPGPGRHEFLAIQPRGQNDPTSGPPPMRSNRSGIGTAVAVRVASTWTQTATFRASSGPGQSLQPLAIGLGGQARADFVSLNWSDGVLQTEVHGVPPLAGAAPRDLSAGRLEIIAENQRQSSSCPLIFAWDGTRYEFVSDVLGVGGIGFAVAPGEYGEPRPWENFLLPAGLPVAREGAFAIKIGEPMEEACYLDAVRLVAWDLPPGWSMTLDERFAILGPAVTGEARHYRRLAVPVKAMNDRNEDVTATVASADLDAAPPGRLDRRFIGRLASDHVLSLDFAEDLSAGPGPPVLLVDGWIEYPYSQTMFAAWQAGAEYRAPTLEAATAEGEWTTVIEQFGYPAGMPREMSLPLSGLPAGTRRLRLRTNQEIYFDRIAVAFAEPCPEARRRELALRRADVAEVGFARRPELAQRRPYYDHDDRTPLWDTRHQPGHYTRFGRADELVAGADDALAIIGPGEEVHLEFESLGPVPDGWTRRFVLETEGWCKDMDMYTRDGETLGPIPARAAPTERRERLHAEYNTRYRSGY